MLQNAKVNINMHQNDSIIKPGTLLVAHPDLTDPFFRESVVLITEVHSSGTLGFCLNQNSGLEMSEILLQYDIEWTLNDTLHIGGPVNDRALVLIHSPEFNSTNTMQITDFVAITSDKLMTEKMLMGDIPRRYKFVSGMSGWSVGQLEKEIENDKSWLTCEANEAIVFSDSEQQWRKAIDLCASTMIDQYI